MDTITKEEITKLIQKSKEKEPAEAIIAVRITSYGVQIMIVGIIWWILLYFSFLFDTVEGLALSTLIGSTLLGVSIFIISSGTNLYFRFHNKNFPPHWLYRVFMRTIIQFYYFCSFLVIFINTRLISIETGTGFLILFVLFCIPGILSYPISYSKRVEKWFDKRATSSIRNSVVEK